MIFYHKLKFIFYLVVPLIVFSFSNANAANLGEITSFNVDKSFDASARTQISAILIKSTNSLHYYVEKTWWDGQLPAKRQEILDSLNLLSIEFDNKIYPTLSSVFGSEWKPGVDGDKKISILFEAMNSSEGGYFREADGYVKLQVPISNEREMLYLSLDYITDSQIKRVIAHELVHLITFNQKNKNFNVEEETWLNEARADYSSTILGYDDKYEGSNLQQRVRDFVENPSDSIIEWQGSKYDYASVSLFMHYLVDHYGISILTDSLKSKLVGIDSLNHALQKNESKEDFSQIFTNWTISLIVNDCSANRSYCYLNQNLKNIKLAPGLNFLPLTGNVSLSVTNVTKNWTGNWLKFIGGNGDLKLDFSSLKGLTFRLPYIVGDSVGSYAVKFLVLDQDEKGQINISKFGTDYKSLIIIPTLQSEVFRSDDIQPTYPFTYTVSVTSDSQIDNQDLIQQLLDRIAYLKNEIAKILGTGSSDQNQCASFTANLYMGMTNNNDVTCLQQFLKNQGTEIYPEGLITGNFGSLTKKAVIKFQIKYKIIGTGFVGPITRAKINQILNGE